MSGEPMKMTIYLPDALAAEVKAGLTDTNISAVCQAALRVELEREKAVEKIDADGYQRVVLYDVRRRGERLLACAPCPGAPSGRGPSNSLKRTRRARWRWPELGTPCRAGARRT